MRLTVLGSGTSHGVPMIGCHCPVCTSADPRNRRQRTSAAIRWADPADPAAQHTILVDAGPELRLQAIAAGIDRVDAVFITHGHADHIMGFDDLRRFPELQGKPLPIYAGPQVLGRLMRVFDYCLTDISQGTYGVPVVRWESFDGPVEIAGHRVTPVYLAHGIFNAYGIRIDAPDGRALAWCPDCWAIPPEARRRLEGLDALFLDGLRHRPHPTHFTVAQAVEAIRDLRPRRAWLIHMTHDLDHEATERTLPDGIRLSYDGMTVDL
jgi:phosphoribosyl 1,2-cyclic phosphate phosphodiesterase